MAHIKWILAAPLLAFITLGAWALASPVGSSPDDDYHLISAWCSSGDAGNCLPGGSATSRVIPDELLVSPCYAYHPDSSAACQGDLMDIAVAPTVESNRGNFQHAYPPVYYATMGLFAGPHIAESVLWMRAFNVMAFVALTSLTFFLLPTRRRSTLVWGWLTTLIPLGFFLVASNNPSGWAVTGVGTAWIALLGYFETSGRRRIGLGSVFAIAVLMAAGSRADAALFAAMAIAVVMFVKFASSRAFLVASILPVAAAVGALVVFATSGQIGAGVDGFTDPVGATVSTVSPSSLLAYNIINLPFLWTGVFGGWGLGWIDTELPAVVMWAGAASFIAVGYMGLSRLDWRKAVAVGGVGAMLVAIPLYVLGKGGDSVGTNVQPRYLLPLVVLLGGLLMLEPTGRRISLTRVQVITVGAALVIANLVALETNIRRYVTGDDVAGFNLNSGAEWWWDIPISPMAVWLVGSAAFAGLVVILLREVAVVRDPVIEAVPAGS